MSLNAKEIREAIAQLDKLRNVVTAQRDHRRANIKRMREYVDASLADVGRLEDVIMSINASIDTFVTLARGQKEVDQVVAARQVREKKEKQ